MFCLLSHSNGFFSTKTSLISTGKPLMFQNRALTSFLVLNKCEKYYTVELRMKSFIRIKHATINTRQYLTVSDCYHGSQCCLLPEEAPDVTAQEPPQ